MTFKKSDFNFHLPENLVAHFPLKDRSSSKLLVYKEREIIDSKTDHLHHHVPKGSIFIRNNSKVIPSRIFGQSVHGGKIEIMLIQPVTESTSCRWNALGRPLKKLKEGSVITFGDVSGTITKKVSDAETPFVEIEFSKSWDEFYSWIQDFGHIPLPPYIKRDAQVPAKNSPDLETYQTVYAKSSGSVAAPTAGLHFTSSLIENLKKYHEVQFVDVTLHVGAGTFLPVKTENLESHKMHSETYFVSTESYHKITQGVQEGRKIFAVGTTSLRCLESFYHKGALYKNWDKLTDRWHTTDLFIRPENRNDIYKPRWLDGIMTNFHQPESTLLMLISALIGYDETKSIYLHAINNSYRFYSYGDSSLLHF